MSVSPNRFFGSTPGIHTPFSQSRANAGSPNSFASLLLAQPQLSGTTTAQLESAWSQLSPSEMQAFSQLEGEFSSPQNTGGAALSSGNSNGSNTLLNTIIQLLLSILSGKENTPATSGKNSKPSGGCEDRSDNDCSDTDNHCDEADGENSNHCGEADNDNASCDNDTSSSCSAEDGDNNTEDE